MTKRIAGILGGMGPEATKTLYQVMITVESLGRNRVLRALRTNFPIERYMVVPIENVCKRASIPI